MGRTKEYDREEVLEKAAPVFRKSGYGACSMTELVAATGLNTASMYKEFGSKEGLYEATLDAMYDKWIEADIALLKKDQGINNLKSFFSYMGRRAQQRTSFEGCLFMNNLVASNVLGSGVLARVDKVCRVYEDLFEENVRVSIESGELNKDRDAKSVARYLLCVMQGMVLYGRIQRYLDDIETVVEEAFAQFPEIQAPKQLAAV